MAKTKGEDKGINYSKVNEWRQNLESLLNDYQKMSNFDAGLKRALKNRHKKIMIISLLVLMADIIILIVGSVFIWKYFFRVTILLVLMLIISGILLYKNRVKFEKYNSEATKIRDQELCNILDKKCINVGNLDEVINYFLLNIEPKTDRTVKTPEFIKSILGVGSKIFYLILGIAITGIVRDTKEDFKIKIYSVIILTIIILPISLILIQLMNYWLFRDKYSDLTKNLLSDLRRIKFLNRF